jgi:hypothetical protein
MAGLTKEQIAAIDDLSSKVVPFDVPEWGGVVYIRPMSVGELDDYSNAVVRAKPSGGLPNFRAGLVAKCLCDESGKRLFSDEEILVLGQKNAVVMNRLYKACDDLNDISPKKVEDIAGNSSAGQPESSSSGSPAISKEHSDKSTECQSPSSASGGPSTDTSNPSAESGNKSGG